MEHAKAVKDGLQSELANWSVRDLVDERAHSSPDATFLIDPDTDESITYVELRQRVRWIAQMIYQQGIDPGQSVAFAMHNGSSSVVTILGIIYGGFRAVAVNLVAGRDVIAYVLSHSETQLILTQTEHSPLINEALDCDAFDQQSIPPMVKVLDCYRGGSDVATVAVQDIATQVDSDGLLMYTSGTTGKPKGVVLSHGNLIAGGANVTIGHQLSEDDRALCVLPLYHINGLCVTVFGPLVSKGSVVVPQRFSTSLFWQWIDNHKCTWFSVVPTQIAYLLRDAEEKTTRPWLRFGRSASAPLSPDVHKHFETQFGVPLVETMGLTETSAQILSNPMPPGIRKLGSPGIPVGDEARIVDNHLQDVPAGFEGELLIRGANVMQRYFKNQEATADTFVDDGWLRTGDLAKMDEQGYVFITGRLKELIIKGGENIAPREIDDALYQHVDVVEAAAFAQPCQNFGQRVEAAVTLKSTSSLAESDLLRLCTERVGKFKCPDKIHFLPELPKGPSGKIQRKKLQELLGSR